MPGFQEGNPWNKHKGKDRAKQSKSVPFVNNIYTFFCIYIEKTLTFTPCRHGTAIVILFTKLEAVRISERILLIHI